MKTEKVFIKKDPKMGRGVYARRDIKRGEIIENSPVIVFNRIETFDNRTNILNHYVYEWNDEETALALGVGSLFNHAEDCNVDYTVNSENHTITFKAIRPIMKGEQLFVDYGYDPVGPWESYLNRNKRQLK